MIGPHILNEFKMEEQYKLFYSKRDYDRATSFNYWIGCLVGAVGMFALILILGLYFA